MSSSLLLLFLLPVLCSAVNLTASLSLQCSFLNASFSSATWPPPSADCCTWHGVSCGPRTGRITGLDLSNRSITGSVGPSLFELTSLRTLNLAHNLFDKIPVPSGLESLRNLTHLNLSNSGFTGQIPAAISRLTSLVSLDLSTFYLNEASNFSLKLDDPDLATLIRNLTNLRELYLDGVNISKSGREWCGVLASSVPGLTALSLTGCSIAGPIDARLSKISNLSVVRLDQNQLNCSVPDFFANFASLRVLRLSFCGLRGGFPESIFGLSNLTDVDLSSNRMLSGTLPDFPEGSRIQNLVITVTNFSGQLPDSIGNMKFLSRLDLSYSRFWGQIPASIGKLTQLVSLDLSMNRFSGKIPAAMPPRVNDLSLSHNSLNESIPSSFGMLLNLTKVDLRNNSLSGPIPASLFSLPSLQQLELNLNQLSGGIEFSNASDQLGIVDLSNNELSGEFPKSVFKLSGVKILTLARNNFSGIVELDWFSDLKNLSSLDLSYNRLSVQDRDGNSSFSFPTLSTMNLASCNLTQVPSFLKSQDQMTYLDLSNNRIGGGIPNWIWESTKLTYLNLSLNSFTFVEGPLPNSSMSSAINQLDLHSNLLQGPIPLPPGNAIILDYSNNLFSSSIPPNISSYLSFTLFFSLANSSIVGEIPQSICSATFLKVLDFSDNKLTGSIPSCIFQDVTDLRVLNLRNNSLQSIIPKNINKGCLLKTINLNGNRLEGDVPSSLANCSTLEVLDLGNNNIVGSFPFWLSSISSLRVLVLRSNELHGPLVATQTDNSTSCSFPVLQILDLSSNHFSGNLPLECLKNLKGMINSSVRNSSTVEYKYMDFAASYYHDTVTVTIKGMDLALEKILTIFTSIDLSNNRFVGEIPREIVNLRSLLLLNLSHNALTGQIPGSVGNLSQLESLDLSVNQLSGEIPQGLALLNFLSVLNLSSNKLVGRIPLGNQLLTFSDTSFQDNQGLCGSPLSKQCGSPSTETPSGSSTATEVNWQFIFIGFGFGGSLAVVVGLIMVWDTGMKWYNRKLDRLLWAILPRSFWRLCDYFGDRRVAAEEGESVEMERWPSRSFCVFCTTMNFYEDRLLLHHVECDCSRSRAY